MRCIVALGLVLVGGTLGYELIEGWTPWKSLFFTIVTITTVGYGDYGLSENGELFTVVVMIAGIGTVSIALGQVLTNAVSRALKPEKRMLQLAKQLKNHHIVCGYGRMGERVCARLLEDGAEFVVLDRDPGMVDIARAAGHIALRADATDDHALQDANIYRAVAVAAITPSDATNALVCLSAKALCPDLVIVARAEHQDSVSKLHRAGAQRVISPSVRGADGVAHHLLRPEIDEVLVGTLCVGHAGDDSIAFTQIVITPECSLLGRTVREMGAEHPGIAFVAVHDESGGTRLRPDNEHRFAEHEAVVVAGDEDAIAALRPERIAA